MAVLDRSSPQANQGSCASLHSVGSPGREFHGQQWPSRELPVGVEGRRTAPMDRCLRHVDMYAREEAGWTRIAWVGWREGCVHLGLELP